MNESNLKMNESDKQIEELLQRIDKIPLVPDEELDNMDFYELSYYMQVLNTIDSLDGEDLEESGE